MGACFQNNEDLVDRLLKIGANVNLQNKMGDNALMFASLSNSKNII